MPFIVYEQDTLVQADIFETLSTAFEDVIHLLPSLDQAADAAAQLGQSAVIVLSVASSEKGAVQKALSSALTTHPVVLVSTSPLENTPSDRRFAFVNRPFTSESLVQAVNDVLSDLPPSRI